MTYQEFEQKILEKKKSGKVFCIAHRGFSGVAYENSLESIKKGLEASFVDGIEFDLQSTSDGHIVLRHNKAIKTKTGYKWVKDISYYELRELISAEKCPEFESVLDVWHGSDKTMDIEIKTDGIADKVISMCKQHGLYQNVIFSSLFYEMHSEIRSIDSNVARMIGYPRDRGKDIAQRKWAYYFVGIIVIFMKLLLPYKFKHMLKEADTKFISFYHKVVTKKITDLVHNENSYLIGVVINLNGDTKEEVAKKEITKLLSYGVDVIKTDFPKLLY